MLPHEELSVAICASEWVYGKLPLAEMALYLNSVNAMTYDYHGSWEKRAMHHTPLYETVHDPDLASSQKTIAGYLAAGVPAQKLVLGIAFYGRGWQNVPDGGTYGLGQSADSGFESSYDEIKALIGHSGFQRYWDEQAQAPYLYSPTNKGGTFISYDDPESITRKTQFALDHHLGGVMAWEITQNKADDDLIEQIDRVLSGRN